MPTSHGYLKAKSWSSASTETAPTTASTFFTPQFFPNADSLEITFTEFTVNNSDNSATVELWYKSRDEAGNEFVAPYSTSLVTISGSSTTMQASEGRVQLQDVPAASWFLRANSVAGTGAFVTGDAYARYYMRSET